jgi:hypothetical protein
MARLGQGKTSGVATDVRPELRRLVAERAETPVNRLGN